MTPIGWTGLVLVAALQTVSLPLFYLALPRVGGVESRYGGQHSASGQYRGGVRAVRRGHDPHRTGRGRLVLLGIWMMQRLDKGPSR